MTLTRKFKPALLLIVLCSLQSCVSYRHSNFNRQKFLNLKKTDVKSPDEGREDVLYTASDPMDSRPDKIPTAVNQADSLSPEMVLIAPIGTSFACESKEQPFRFIHQVKRPFVFSASTKFKQISVEKKSESVAMEDYDNLFRSGAMLFILFALFMVMAFLATSPYMLFICSFTSPILFLASWLIGTFLALRSGKIPESEQGKYFKLKKITAWSIAILGLITIPLSALVFYQYLK